MRLPYFDFVEVTSLREVHAAMERYGKKARLLAGGTDILPLIEFGLAAPAYLIGLKNVTELKGIRRKGQSLHIGTMTTLAEIEASAAIKKLFPALHDAARAVAAPPLRNVATIGGNIFQNSRCLYYNQSSAWRRERQACLKAGGSTCIALPGGRKCFSVYQGDCAPALIAHNAKIRMAKKRGKPREFNVQDLFTGAGHEPLRREPGEIATEIILSVPRQKTGSSYQKLRLRPAMDYALAGAAASVTVGRRGIEAVRLVLSATGPAPVIVPLDEVVGKKPSDIDLESIAHTLPKNLPIVNNLFAPATYRRKMLAVYARKAVEAALERL